MGRHPELYDSWNMVHVLYKIMIDFELNLPPAKEKKGFTQKEFENWIAKRPSRKESDGAWAKFVADNQEAVRKDKLVAKARAEAKAKKKMSALDWIDFNIATYEPDIATKKQKEKLENLKIFKNNINNRVATKPTEEGLFEVYLQMIKAGELLPNTSFRDFEKNYPNLDINLTKKPLKKKPTPVRTASVWSSIKNSSIYKLLENEKLLATELGHESLIELIHLAQNAGLLKKGGRVK